MKLRRRKPSSGRAGGAREEGAGVVLVGVLECACSPPIVFMLNPDVPCPSYDGFLRGPYDLEGLVGLSSWSVTLAEWLLAVPSLPVPGSMKGIAFQ